MFNRKRGSSFLGRDNVPDDPPNYVREDSPRHHHVRNPDAKTQDLDEKLKRLSPMLVRDQSGHVFKVVGHAGLKDGWTLIGPAPETPPTHELWEVPAKMHGSHILTASQITRMPITAGHVCERKGWRRVGCEPPREPREDIDERNDIGGGETMSRREAIQITIDADAHELRVGEYRTGRVIYDGGDRIVETRNDADMAKRVHERGELPTFEDTTKPKPEIDTSLWHDPSKDRK